MYVSTHANMGLTLRQNEWLREEEIKSSDKVLLMSREDGEQQKRCKKENLLSLSRTKDLLMTINNYSQTL